MISINVHTQRFCWDI